MGENNVSTDITVMQIIDEKRVGCEKSVILHAVCACPHRYLVFLRWL